jgi:hypothetical protein
MSHKVNGTFQKKALAAGVNAVVATYALGETASGSTTIAICGLPAGAQVISCAAKINHAALNAGANAGALKVYATIGGTNVAALIATSTANTSLSLGTGAGHGVRMTGSANLVVSLHDCVGTGTATTQFTVLCTYLSEKSGD